ncbi:MAG: hypothetical protein GX905_07575 [Bacteroidales bacterium]|nr:hypothetical protein [Bacteroidales bacterium]
MVMRVFNLLNLVFVLGVLPMMVYGQETHQKLNDNSKEQNLILYTPYTKIAVPPGEIIDYSIDVINNYDKVKNASLSVSGIPRGWKSEIKAGGFTISQLSVLPDEKKTFNLQVQVPLKVNKGTYYFSVNAGELGSLPLTVTISEQGTFKTEFTTTQPNMEGNSKSTFTFNTNLKNSTADQQLYALAANAPQGWNVVFKVNYKQATSAQVEANKTENITIDITPPANVKAGTYKIPVSASTGSTSDKIELEVVITGSYEIALTTPSGRISSDITAGSTKRIDLIINNSGSAELKDIQLNSTKPSDWEVTFEPNKIEVLKSGETANATAIIKASKKALPGDYIVKMEARMPEVNSNIDFRITVETSLLYGWLGIVIILIVIGGIYFLFRKYGRR